MERGDSKGVRAECEARGREGGRKSLLRGAFCAAGILMLIFQVVKKIDENPCTEYSFQWGYDPRINTKQVKYTVYLIRINSIKYANEIEVAALWG